MLKMSLYPFAYSIRFRQKIDDLLNGYKQGETDGGAICGSVAKSKRIKAYEAFSD